MATPQILVGDALLPEDELVVPESIDEDDTDVYTETSDSKISSEPEDVIIWSSGDEDEEEEDLEMIEVNDFFRSLEGDFSKRIGTSGIGGQIFEIELAMLILFQGLPSGEDDEPFKFSLATNMKEAGDFDDLVVKYTPLGTEEKKIIFLEARYKEGVEYQLSLDKLLSTLDKNESFALSNIFSSYLKVKKHFRAETKVHPVFESNFDHCEFVIYTSAEGEVEFDENNKNIKRSNVEKKDIMNFLEKNHYYEIILSGDEEADGKILDALSCGSDCKRLANELVCCIFPEEKKKIPELLTQGIVQEYEVSLSEKVFTKGEKSEIGKFSKSFLNGDESLSVDDGKFREVFFDELKKRESLSEKTEKDLISELENVEIKLTGFFKEAKEQSLPSKILSDGSECKTLATELVSCIFPEEKKKIPELLSQDIVQEYEVSIAKKVFTKGEKPEIMTLSKSFLKGEKTLSDDDRKFREVFFDVLRNRESLSKKTDEDLISELENVEIKLPERFKEAKEQSLLPSKRVSCDSDYKTLATEFVSCIFPEEKNKIPELLSQGIVQEYEVSLAKKVFTKEGESENGTFSKSFLKGDKTLSDDDRKFREVFFDALRMRESLSKKTDEDLISELENVEIKLPERFKEAKESATEQALPTKIVSLEERMEFLSKLKLFVGQPNSADLSEIIKKKIISYFQVNTNDVGKAFSHAEYDLRNWWKEKGDFITEDNKILEAATRISISFDVTSAANTFVGRIRELKKLHYLMQKVKKEAAVISQIDILRGVGGIGKSELARKYIEQFGKCYDGNTIWIDAQNEATIKDSFVRLAKSKLKVSTRTENGEPKELDVLVADIYEYFSVRESLFIFDDAKKYRTEYKEEDKSRRDVGVDIFLSPTHLPPDVKKPSFIITSKSPFKWNDLGIVKLGILNEREAVSYIRKELELEYNARFKGTQNMAIMLQHHPSALAESVKYIRDSAQVFDNVGYDFSVNEYIEYADENTRELISVELEKDLFLLLPRVV